MDGTFIEAKKLRDKTILNQLPKDRPGYYKWWAKREELQAVLDKLEVKFEEVEKFLEIKDEYYCIYVGVAIKESVKARLDWHVNQENTERVVKNGTLSTLRQTISSLFGKNMADTEATNKFIDKLLIEYFLSANPIKSDMAKNEIHKIEIDLLSSDKLYILNIQDNKHALAQRKKLTSLRKKARCI